MSGLIDDRDEWQEVIEIPGRGVFRVRYHRLSARAIRNIVARRKGEIWRLRREIARLQAEIARRTAQLREKEAVVNSLTDERVKRYVEEEKRRRVEAEARAEEFLRGYLGEERYAELVEKGFYVFEGLDGGTYRISRNGVLEERDGKYWLRRCVVRKSGLPLPDFIASVITAVKHDPYFLDRSRRLSRREEVRA